MIRKTLVLGTLILVLTGADAMAAKRLGRKFEIIPDGGVSRLARRVHLYR